jgi:hypothetical protein
MVFAVTARHGQRLDLSIVLIQQMTLWPLYTRPPLAEEIQEVLGDGVRLRRVLLCCRQVTTSPLNVPRFANVSCSATAAWNVSRSALGIFFD